MKKLIIGYIILCILIGTGIVCLLGNSLNKAVISVGKEINKPDTTITYKNHKYDTVIVQHTRRF